MLLPGRLRHTTLGDVLGTMHRAGATGTLEMVEERGRTHRIHLQDGLVLAVEMDGVALSLAEVLRRDRIVGEDVLRRSLRRALSSQRLHGEVLVHEFHVPRTALDAALRQQILSRLNALQSLVDAQLHFRVAVRPPRSALRGAPLGPREFLTGRPRARDRERERRRACAPAFACVSASASAFPTASPAAPAAPSASASARASASASAPRPGSTRAGRGETPSAYTVLGVPPGSPAPSIKQAYRALVRRLHPDVHPRASDAERRALAARFSEVTAAYRDLMR